MIPVAAGVRVWLATGITDMRKGFDGLAALVQEKLRHDPHGGQLFVLRGKRGDRIKLLWHDGQGLCLIGMVYAIEDGIRGKPPDERQRIREERAQPLLAELKAWLEATLPKLSAKTDLAKAIRYALSRWNALTRYIHDGRIEIDNNAAERAIRGVALGRKNYLFAGSDSGGERAAAIYCLIETCKLNDIDPEAYLRSTIARIAEHPINHITELLPWNWASNQPTAQAA